MAVNLFSAVSTAPTSQYDKVLLVPRHDAAYVRDKYIRQFLKAVFNLFIRRKWHYSPSKRLFPRDVVKTFAPYASSFRFESPGSTFSSVEEYCHRREFDLLFPCIQAPSSDFDRPWIGYIYDCQEKHLPHFFSQREIRIRDRNINDMLKRHAHIIVTSASVKNDLYDFYAPFPAQIHSLPFSPRAPLEFIDESRDLRSQYGISKSKKYFIVCNQFWRHKNHENLIKSFARLLSLEGQRYQLVCTGTISDPRYPNYFDSITKLVNDLNLSDDVLILGRIPKLAQVSLIKTSLALIQPTLFEGAPGGGSAFDAIGLGHPLLVSDIPVNREITSRYYLDFFDPHDINSMADSMLKVSRLPSITSPLRDDLIASSREHGLVLQEFLCSLFDTAISDFRC